MSDKLKGFLPLARQIQDNWLWSDKPFARGQAWIDLLILANFDDGKVMSKGVLVDVQRGQVFRTIKFLANRWGWNVKKVRVFLETLERESMVTTQGLTNGTLITIENYAFYNNKGQTKGISDDTTEDTSKGQQKASQGSHKNKNKKNNKNDNDYLNTRSEVKEESEPVDNFAPWNPHQAFIDANRREKNEWGRMSVEERRAIIKKRSDEVLAEIERGIY